ncbi:MAG: hypothetical protein HY699_13420 [Deltaproteobacteria bacterium]|nr:hypothetical protein [Deltaproteobacteria bacterium]
MREVAWWCLPGLAVIGPLALLLQPAAITAPWPVWLIASAVLGVLLHQSVRSWFEAQGNGFRSPHRAALAAIIERGQLEQRQDRGDLAYQVYELVFYEQSEWQPVRDHLHRCWFYVLWFWTIALGCALGAGLSLLALLCGARPLLALLYLAALPPLAVILRRKGGQTHAALELFDRALVLTHWPLYETKLGALLRYPGATPLL